MIGDLPEALPRPFRWASADEAAPWVMMMGQADCVVASLATVLGETYEVTADLIGYPCYPSSKWGGSLTLAFLSPGWERDS